ncbi:MAG: hypothetical protein KC549_10655 [Myxococcales bacterium]|nr:hypothetical protein [Myxococcales bacterium]MCB9547965.1 hypothetical protein [Myxococcales bacterium]
MPYDEPKARLGMLAQRAVLTALVVLLSAGAWAQRPGDPSPSSARAPLVFPFRVMPDFPMTIDEWVCGLECSHSRPEEASDGWVRGAVCGVPGSLAYCSCPAPDPWYEGAWEGEPAPIFSNGVVTLFDAPRGVRRRRPGDWMPKIRRGHQVSPPPAPPPTVRLWIMNPDLLFWGREVWESPSVRRLRGRAPNLFFDDCALADDARSLPPGPAYLRVFQGYEELPFPWVPVVPRP